MYKYAIWDPLIQTIPIQSPNSQPSKYVGDEGKAAPNPIVYLGD